MSSKRVIDVTVWATTSTRRQSGSVDQLPDASPIGTRSRSSTDKAPSRFPSTRRHSVSNPLCGTAARLSRPTWNKRWHYTGY